MTLVLSLCFCPSGSAVLEQKVVKVVSAAGGGVAADNKE